MAKSDFLENEMLDHVIGGAAYTAPGTLHIGLADAAITDATTGSTVSEPSAGGYARVAVTNNLTEWPAASGGSKSNANIIDFGTATASWGTVTHWFIADAPTGGNILYHAPLDVSKTINQDDPVSFPAGNLTVSET